MFNDYTTDQLVQLRTMCANVIERTEDVKRRMDVLLIIDHIDQELIIRMRTTKYA
jgi:hypothetical protein